MQRLIRSAILLAAGLAGGCRGPLPPPPPPLWIGGLPVSGSLADARSAGFNRCIAYNTEMRCRRSGVMLLGQGPYSAAVDLAGSDGSGGFDHLILWHDGDQSALIAVTAVLERQGWRACYTGEGRWGDQAIYTRTGAAMHFSMDLSYWAKRRLRVFPGPAVQSARC